MGDQLSLHPTGLTPEQFNWLSDSTQKASGLSPEQLRETADRHLQETFTASQKNPLVNLRLARAIHETLQKVLQNWKSLTPAAQSWFAGAILYFAKSNDDEPDFSSPIGFEDDTEVLNSCLRYAGLDEFCLNPEDYDDV